MLNTCTLIVALGTGSCMEETRLKIENYNVELTQKLEGINTNLNQRLDAFEGRLDEPEGNVTRTGPPSTTSVPSVPKITPSNKQRCYSLNSWFCVRVCVIYFTTIRPWVLT